MKQNRVFVLFFLLVLVLPMVVLSEPLHAKGRKQPSSDAHKQIQALKLKLLQHKLMLVELYRKNKRLTRKIQQHGEVSKKQEDRVNKLKDSFLRLLKRFKKLKKKVKCAQANINRYKKKHHTSCFQLLKLFPNTKSGWHTIYRKKKPVRVYCDMKTAGGGWTRFIHHSDPNGQTPISQPAWDKGIQFAADGGIKQWMVKTFTNSHHNSEKKSKFTNAWTMTLATKVQGAKFTHFKFQHPHVCGTRRYSGIGFVAKAALIPNSQCKNFYHQYSGTFLWGEYKWCGEQENDVSWLWMPRCNNGFHLLNVNYGYQYNEWHQRTETRIGIAKGYDKNGGGFEFFSIDSVKSIFLEKRTVLKWSCL